MVNSFPFALELATGGLDVFTPFLADTTQSIHPAGASPELLSQRAEAFGAALP